MQVEVPTHRGALMSPDDKKYYENFRNLFLTDGWKQYVEESVEALKLLDLRSCKDWDSFLVTKTKIGMLDTIIQFEVLIKQAEKSAEEALASDLEIEY